MLTPCVADLNVIADLGVIAVDIIRLVPTVHDADTAGGCYGWLLSVPLCSLLPPCSVVLPYRSLNWSAAASCSLAELSFGEEEEVGYYCQSSVCIVSCLYQPARVRLCVWLLG